VPPVGQHLKFGKGLHLDTSPIQNRPTPRTEPPPALPLYIRIAGPPEEGWTQASTLEDLALRLESELEEKVLRYKLALKDRLHLEWSWQEEPDIGGMECTILAHICTGTNVISVQNKRHLHWKATEAIMAMNSQPWPTTRYSKTGSPASTTTHTNTEWQVDALSQLLKGLKCEPK